MTVEKFLEEYNGSAMDLEEIAYIATNIDGSTAKEAQEYIAAHERWENVLEDIGFEFG